MCQSDKELVAQICCLIAVIGLVVGGVVYMTKRLEPSTDDLTGQYELPPELSGCHVYRLLPKGHGTWLYVVTDGDRPVATTWIEGKHIGHVELIK